MDQSSLGFRLLLWGFLTAFTILIVVSFGLALSRLDDAGVIGVGVVALAASVIAVALQGVQLKSMVDTHTADAMSTPGDLPIWKANSLRPDRFVVRSYSLIVRPDLIASLHTNFTVGALESSGVHMSERGFIRCGSVVSRGDVSFAADASFFVVNRAATSDGFRSDVMDGHVSSIMVGGALLRIVSLTALDFAGDTNNIASDIALGNDIYVLSARGSVGSVPVDTSKGCTSIDTYMPWGNNSVVHNVTATAAILHLMESVTTGGQVPIQVWGIGGR